MTPSIPISVGSLVVVALLLTSAVACGLAVGRGPSNGSAGERALAWIFGLFGIGGVAVHLVLWVLFSSGAIAALALELIARLHLGPAYPDYFPVDALVSGLAVGLGAARLLAASRSRAADPEAHM